MVRINDNATVLHIADVMPAFCLPSVSGLQIESKLIKDPIVVVLFTCHHCPYAQAYTDRLVTLAQQFESQAQFVLISSNDASQYPEDSFEEMKRTSERFEFAFPYCYDETQAVAKAFGALCTPHCFVFNQERLLQYKGRIDDNWQYPKQVSHHSLQQAISAIATGEPVENRECNAIGCSLKWKQ